MHTCVCRLGLGGERSRIGPEYINGLNANFNRADALLASNSLQLTGLVCVCLCVRARPRNPLHAGFVFPRSGTDCDESSAHGATAARSRFAPGRSAASCPAIQTRNRNALLEKWPTRSRRGEGEGIAPAVAHARVHRRAPASRHKPPAGSPVRTLYS